MYTRYNDWSGTRRQVSSGKEIFLLGSKSSGQNPLALKYFLFFVFFFKAKAQLSSRYTFLETKLACGGNFKNKIF
jgi:hypothetical protein